MRHLVEGRKLNRSTSHRRAMLANLATSILDKERVTTTVAKAKEVRGVVERLITYSKRGNLHGVRLAARTVRDKTVLKKLFDEIGPGYQDRQGGYLRIVKAGYRDGDNASMCVVELVGRGSEDIQRKRKGKKKPARKKTARSSAKAPQTKSAKPAEEPQESAAPEQKPEEKAEQTETTSVEKPAAGEAEAKAAGEEKNEAEAQSAEEQDKTDGTKGEAESEKNSPEKK